MPGCPRPIRNRHVAGFVLLGCAGCGGAWAMQAVALSALPLWCAVLLAQGLAAAAVAGMALLAVPPPGLVRRVVPKA